MRWFAPSIPRALLAAFALTSSLPEPAFAQMPTADGFNPTLYGSVAALALQADGRILAVGFFGWSEIARLNPDGTFDRSFGERIDNTYCRLAVQADGKILVGGLFWHLGREPRTNIARLNADGTLDSSFDPGANSAVDSLVVQPDGKILVGGSFTKLAGQTRLRIARLNPDGTLDTGFDPGAEGCGVGVNSLAVQADGKIVVGGWFETLGGRNHRNIGRLYRDGTPDAGFSSDVDGPVSSLVVQADGKILVAGSFSWIDRQSRTNIARLNPDGTADRAFDPRADGPVNALALQADGKIVVGGTFTRLGGQPRANIGRLNPDGSVDAGFDPGACGDYLGSQARVRALALQADGKVLVGGWFTTLGGLTRTCLGRLNTTTPTTHCLTYDGSMIGWLRGGASPEVWRVAFETSTDGLAWTGVSEGQRIPGGWQVTNAEVVAGAMIRARGYVGGGGIGEGVVETAIRALPLILSGDGAFGVVSNTFRFNLGGAPGWSVVLEASTNLREWQPLQTNVLAASRLSFRDPIQPLAGCRFYRARVGP